MQNTYEKNKLISLLQDRVQTYFQSKENRKKFEKWYKEKYGKQYKWGKPDEN